MPILGNEHTIMLKTKETAEIRRIKRWYDQIMEGLRPTKAEFESQFRGYVDQAALLVQRIEEGHRGKTSSLESTALRPAC